MKQFGVSKTHGTFQRAVLVGAFPFVSVIVSHVVALFFKREVGFTFAILKDPAEMKK